MKYYLYYSPDFKTEYFVEKINKTTLSKIYEKLKEYIEPWFGCELLSFDDFSKSNKIIISYPIFNYNKVVMEDYPESYCEHMDESLSYQNQLSGYSNPHLAYYMRHSNKILHCYINKEVYNAKNGIEDVCNEFLKEKLPKPRSGNICIDIRIEMIEDNDFKDYNKNTVDILKEDDIIDIIPDYEQIFIFKIDKENYIPCYLKNNKINGIESDSEFFNDEYLLRRLIEMKYNLCRTDIETIKHIDIKCLKLNLLKLINVSDTQYPEYVYIPVNNDNDIIDVFGSIDNQYFSTKTMAVLYASKFQNTKIIDNSLIPYINGGLPFDIKNIDFDTLNQIKNIDSMYVDMQYKKNTINSINKHGEKISSSINNVANANNNIANKIETGAENIAKNIRIGLQDVSNSIAGVAASESDTNINVKIYGSSDKYY